MIIIMKYEYKVRVDIKRVDIKRVDIKRVDIPTRTLRITALEKKCYEKYQN